MWRKTQAEPRFYKPVTYGTFVRNGKTLIWRPQFTGRRTNDTESDRARAAQLGQGPADRGRRRADVLRQAVRAGPCAQGPVQGRHEGAGQEAHADDRVRRAGPQPPRADPA